MLLCYSGTCAVLPSVRVVKPVLMLLFALELLSSILQMFAICAVALLVILVCVCITVVTILIINFP
jgi:hypothetical protein